MPTDTAMSSGDGGEDGVWEVDVEVAFNEAIDLYPPCGRRKIVDQSKGKMYGRNELIAKYIFEQTGKTRTRKQVSSHIQVLARKKQKEMENQVRKEVGDDTATMASLKQIYNELSSAQIVSSTKLNNASSKMVIKTLMEQAEHTKQQGGSKAHKQGGAAQLRLELVELSAFIEFRLENTDTYHQHALVHIGPQLSYSHSMEKVDIAQIADKFVDLPAMYEHGPQDSFFLIKSWADLSTANVNGFYGLSYKYHSKEQFQINCSTKVFSFGGQVVEKMQMERAVLQEGGGGKYAYYFNRCPMCDYMVQFIEKLKKLRDRDIMNSVLENFSVLQVITAYETGEVLLVLAFVFEVASLDNGAQHVMYSLRG